MTYKEKVAADLIKKQENFHLFQKLLNGEVLNKYGYEVRIPLEDKFNTDRGFFINVSILYKGIRFASLSPNFNSKNEITSMYIELSLRDQLGTVNHSRELNGQEEIEVITNNHKNIQSALEVIETVRKEIAKFYN